LESNAITITLIMNFLRFAIMKGLNINCSRSWKTCAMIMDRFWNPQESRWYAYRCMQENAQYHILPSWKMLNYSTWWTPHTFRSPWCFKRFNYPKYTFTNPNEQTCAQLPNVRLLLAINTWSNICVLQVLKSSKLNFNLIYENLGKWVNMYIVSGGPSMYIDLTFCIWPSSLNNFTNAQYVKLGSFALMLFEQTSWAHTKIKVHLEHIFHARWQLVVIIWLGWFFYHGSICQTHKMPIEEKKGKITY
jgi:hypothetical protein